MRTRIKICCISTLQEAKLAIQYGADALGLVGQMPSGPGPIADELIAAINKTIQPPITAFLLTSQQTSSGIIHHLKRTGVNTVQIVDELSEGSYEEIKEAMPQVRIVQVIHVNGEESLEQALSVHEKVDSILLDSGNPKASIKTLGGTGNTHDWNWSRKIVEAVNVPVFLAGGLHAGNVAEAIETVRPFAVDVCSGVRLNGLLNEDKLKSFMIAVRDVEKK